VNGVNNVNPTITNRGCREAQAVGTTVNIASSFVYGGKHKYTEGANLILMFAKANLNQPPLCRL
jgi:hypothetical protein